MHSCGSAYKLVLKGTDALKSVRNPAILKHISTRLRIILFYSDYFLIINLLIVHVAVSELVITAEPKAVPD